MSTTYKVLIVDDEYPARQEIRYLLKNYENLEIVGEAENAQEALQLIEALDYSILFLDIKMPGIDGLELARKLQKKEKSPLVIFVSAFEQYALDAFGVNAVDYLLKPVNEKRLKEALEKVFARLENVSADSSQKDKNKTPEDEKSLAGVIPVDYQGRTILLKEKEIVFVKSSDDYTEIKTYDKKYLSRFTLKELQKRLDDKLFYRCHRSYLVNVKKIKEVFPLFNGTLLLTVNDIDKSEVPVSRSQAKAFKTFIGIK